MSVIHIHSDEEFENHLAVTSNLVSTATHNQEKLPLLSFLTLPLLHSPPLLPESIHLMPFQVVVYFNQAINAGCRIVTPKYTSFPAKYPKAVFLSVNSEECGKFNVCNGVAQIPHFRLYKNKAQIPGAEFTGSFPNHSPKFKQKKKKIHNYRSSPNNS